MVLTKREAQETVHADKKIFRVHSCVSNENRTLKMTYRKFRIISIYEVYENCRIYSVNVFRK